MANNPPLLPPPYDTVYSVALQPPSQTDVCVNEEEEQEAAEEYGMNALSAFVQPFGPAAVVMGAGYFTLTNITPLEIFQNNIVLLVLMIIVFVVSCASIIIVYSCAHKICYMCTLRTYNGLKFTAAMATVYLYLVAYALSRYAVNVGDPVMHTTEILIVILNLTAFVLACCFSLPVRYAATVPLQVKGDPMTTPATNYTLKPRQQQDFHLNGEERDGRLIRI